MRNAVSRVRSDLPADLREPVVAKVDLAGLPILTYTVGSTRMDPEALSWFVDDTVAKTMLAVRGVGSVVRVGGVTREVRVELDPMRLLALNATASDISRQLRQVQQDASGGRANLGGAEQALRAVATVQSAAELARLEVALSDGRRIRIGQVAMVQDTVAEPRSLALLNGKPVVAFEVTRSRGAGELDVAAAVRKALDQLRTEHPDATITEAFNFVDPAQENFDSSMMLLYEGALLAVLVVWLFVRDWRSTFIAAVALPLSAIPTFAVMHLLGFTLNGVTLLSLSLVVGILVDDAIVEIENIMRHLREGKTPYQAAMEAADEIGLAVIATTFTLIAVFLPTAFMSGVVGKFFVQFGWTAAIAVWFSLVVARLLTPMMSAYMLHPVIGGKAGAKPDSAHHEPTPPWLKVYLRWAQWCLQHRRITLLATLIFLVGGMALATRLPAGFIPADDLSQTQVTITLPPGGSLEQTRALSERARLKIEQVQHIKLVYTAIGGGSAGADAFAPQGLSDVRRATLTIKLSPRSERQGVSKQQVEAQLRQALADLPGARVRAWVWVPAPSATRWCCRAPMAAR